MNFTYFKFLCVTTIKKRPIWITWLLYLLTCISFLIILPAVVRANPLQVWANTTMAVCQTFLGMTVALFTAVLGIHIFKDGLEEGTELIVISKPISRMKTVLTKFFVFGLFCLMVNASSLIVTVLTIFLPTTEVKFYWGLIVSMLIGNLISFGVFGSIAILLTAKFAKIGVIITNILISLIFLIYQCLTLFVFEVPIKSLSNHYVKAPSYIIAERDTRTGEYKETEVVEFKTDYSGQYLNVEEKERNASINWQEEKKYWTDVICKNDPTPILNYTDLAGQVSLTYLSAKIDQYAYRQGHRFFAISRFYTYDLTSPASPEIISGVENKKTLPWVYSKQTSYDITDEEDEPILQFFYPKQVGFSGIAPLGTTRLRGYGDQLPVAYYSKSGEALSTKDIFFEPAEWQKYSKPFNLICDKLFDYDLYKEYITQYEILYDPTSWPMAWSSNNEALRRYYELLWSCFTGHSKEEKYFNNDFLKDYPMSYFDINSVNDLNERFLQFKYFIYFRILDEQQQLFNQPATSDWELKAKKETFEDPTFTFWETLFNLKHFENNWYLQPGDLDTVSFIEPNTQTLNVNLIASTARNLKYDLMFEVLEGRMTQDEANKILANSTRAKLARTQAMYNFIAASNEEFLFNSLDKPSRSAEYHGIAYTVEQDWVPYWETKYITHNGQNMNLFYYSSRETVKFWVYAVVWGIIAFSLFAAGAIVYNKYDVK